MVKNLPAMQKTWVRCSGREDSPEKRMATHSGIYAWRMPWVQEPSGLQSMGSQRTGHNKAMNIFFNVLKKTFCSFIVCIFKKLFFPLWLTAFGLRLIYSGAVSVLFLCCTASVCSALMLRCFACSSFAGHSDITLGKSALLSICFSKNLLSSLTLPYECQNHMRFWEKNSMAIWIGSMCSGSFQGMGAFIALRVPLLIQIFCYVFQQYVVFFFMGSARINFMFHFSSVPDEVTF